MRAAPLVFLLMLVVVLPAHARTGHALTRGDSLKLSRNGVYEVFTLEDIRPDTLLVRDAPGGDLRRVPMTGITGLKVYTGMSRGRGAARGGTIGFFAGALGGFVIGSVMSANNTCAGHGYMCPCDHWAECGVMTGILFALGGTVIGSVIGAARPGMYWEPVDLPISLKLESGDRNHAGLRIAYSFW
jgi:hypothetical protein